MTGTKIVIFSIFHSFQKKTQLVTPHLNRNDLAILMVQKTTSWMAEISSYSSTIGQICQKQSKYRLTIPQSVRNKLMVTKLIVNKSLLTKISLLPSKTNRKSDESEINLKISKVFENLLLPLHLKKHVQKSKNQGPTHAICVKNLF